MGEQNKATASSLFKKFVLLAPGCSEPSRVWARGRPLDHRYVLSHHGRSACAVPPAVRDGGCDGGVARAPRPQQREGKATETTKSRPWRRGTALRPQPAQGQHRHSGRHAGLCVERHWHVARSKRTGLDRREVPRIAALVWQGRARRPTRLQHFGLLPAVLRWRGRRMPCDRARTGTRANPPKHYIMRIVSAALPTPHPNLRAPPPRTV